MRWVDDRFGGHRGYLRIRRSRGTEDEMSATLFVCGCSADMVDARRAADVNIW
jgi:hypothetical protein